MTSRSADIPEPIIRDVVRQELGVWRGYGDLTANVLAALGIDPDMTVESLRRRLRNGARVEMMLSQGPDRFDANEWGLLCAIDVLADQSFSASCSQLTNQ